MSNCGCNSNSTQNGCDCSTNIKAEVACPTCQTYGLKVSALTIRSQVKKEPLKLLEADLEKFHFCTNPECNTVYYNDTQIVVVQDEIKSKVTIKNSDASTPLCYCKKLLKEQFYQMLRDNEPNIAQKIKSIITDGKSFCEKSNPKGICCTEDIKSFLAEHGISWDEENTSGSGCCH